MDGIERAERLSRGAIGSAIEVHRELGPGFLESVYQQALAVELSASRVPFTEQAPVSVSYREQRVGEGRVDFLIGGLVIVELKAVGALHPIHTAQVISYLKATGLHLALLLNFNDRVMNDGIKRIVL